MATTDGVRVEVKEDFEEFEAEAVVTGRGVGSVIGSVGRLAFNVATLPINLLPSRSRYHAKNSIREGFLSVKTFLEDVTGAIDDELSRSVSRDKVRMEIRMEEEDIPPAARRSSPML
jgi:hypothetical protein